MVEYIYNARYAFLTALMPVEMEKGNIDPNTKPRVCRWKQVFLMTVSTIKILHFN